MIHSYNILYENRDSLLKGLANADCAPPDQTLVQVFSGVTKKEHIITLIDDLKAVLPGAPIIGVTTAGEIMDGESLDHTILVNITFFEQTYVRTALITENDDLEEAGQRLGHSLKAPDIQAAIILGCGLKEYKTINAGPMLDALQSVLPDVVIAGGQAGDNGKGITTYAFTNEGITEKGVAGASLSSKHLIINRTYNLSWVPIGKKMTITKAEGSRVYSIDNMPPYQIYAHYLGQEVADGLPLSAADFPLIIERDAMVQAIHATGVNEDGSFQFIHNFHTGEQMRFGYCHAGLLAIGANQTYMELNQKKVEAAFVYSCVSRKWVLGADISVELSPIADLGCSAGFYSYGEYFTHESGRALFLGQTMTVLTLAEESDFPTESPIVNDTKFMTPEETRQFRTLRVLHRLIEKSAREIESINQELASLVHKDTLTDLYNRRRFYDNLRFESKRHLRSGMPMSVILIDVDHFKSYNDTYGHVAGDDCLRGIGQTLRSVAKRPSDVPARYGGEEFAILLPETDAKGARQIGATLRQEIENLNIPHSASKVSKVITASFGVLTLHLTVDLEPEMIVELCDDLLYQAKDSGRNKVISKEIHH